MLFSKDRISIVMLHHVSDLHDFVSLEPYSISNKKFLELLDYIDTHRIQTLNFKDLRNSKINKKSIILTFDDCSKELFNFAIPELEKRNMKAVFYIPTSFIGFFNQWDVIQGKAKIDLFSDDEIVELSSNPNFEVGSHSVSHRKLSELSSEEVLLEMNESREYLEKLTRTEVVSFAYPFGVIPMHYEELLHRANYSFACAIYTKNFNKFALRRFIYHNGDNKWTLHLKFSWFYRIYRSVRDKF
jgi:peptidoglycan/xylan/chitin deacetylase (PgdA/CDA1 family)